MPADLDAALRPGETIVYRTRGRGYGRTAVLIAVMLVVVLLYSTGKFASYRAHDLAFWEFFLTICSTTGAVGAVAVVIFAYTIRRQRRAPDDLVITNRRLLFSKGGWSRKIEAAALDRIERVGWSGSPRAPSIEVVAAGRAIDLPRPRDADALAKALTDAIGVSPLPAIGRMANAEFWLLGAVLVWAVCYTAAWSGLRATGWLPVEDPSSLAFRTIDLILTVFAMGAAWLAYQLVSGLLTATIMRPFVTPQQMQAGLCAGNPDKWHLRIALKWASLLYGRPLPYLNC